VAVVEPGPDATVSVEEVVAACRGRLATFKHPRQVVVVERIARSPVGKPDYPWARRTATEATGPN
jgi:acyl-CoA synthetase (AMP-forming)/AMP-acid ligase II